MKSKIVCTVIIAAFLIQLYGHAMLLIFGEKQTFSEEENRLLAEFPSVSAGEYFSGVFSKRFDLYVNDHFPFRQSYVDVSGKAASLYYFEGFNRDGDIMVLSGVNTGQLFDIDDADSEIGDIDSEPETETETSDESGTSLEQTGMLIIKDRLAEPFSISDSQIRRYTDIVNKLYEECGRPDTYVILPPSSAQLYLPDKYRDDTTDQYAAFETLKSQLNGPEYINLKDIFENHKDEYIYFKTDHHWTALGAYYAYESFINNLGAVPSKLSEYKSGTVTGFKGSLYKALAKYPQYESFKNVSDDVCYYIPKTDANVYSYRNAALTEGETRRLIYPDYSENGNLYNIFMGGDVPLGYIHSAIGNGKSIMVVRDSYGHAFLPYLADNFEHIYSVEPRYFNKNDNVIILSDFFREHRIETLLFLNHSLSASGAYWLHWGTELQKLSRE